MSWKFFVPEPIQTLGVVGASDRFEGHAAERSALLKFIHENGIDKVVFVAADIHSTIVNYLTYQEYVANSQPFGRQSCSLPRRLACSPVQVAFYNSLPIASDADSAVSTTRTTSSSSLSTAPSVLWLRSHQPQSELAVGQRQHQRHCWILWADQDELRRLRKLIEKSRPGKNRHATNLKTPKRKPEPG